MRVDTFWKDKRIFVTGHTGFKGSWLCAVLETVGARVVGYALAPPSRPNLFELLCPRVDSRIGDIRDLSALDAAFASARPEIVIHMAAQPLVLDAYQDPRYTYEVNVMGTVNLLECARRHGGVRSLLNVTTDKVYLNRERPEGYREDEFLNGFDPYSNSKSCSELVTSCYDGAFLRAAEVAVSTARSGNVIGGGDFSANRLIPDCARALTRGSAAILRNPASVRPYQHVLDTLFAYLIIARKQYEDATLAGAYNIGPDEADCARNDEVADLFCAAWGGGARWMHVPPENPPPESVILRLDCAKMKRVFGWSPYWSAKRAVEEAALWYRAFCDGEDVRAVTARQISEFWRSSHE